MSGLSNLYLNEIVVTTLMKKFKYLKKDFFLLLNANLSEINDFIYIDSLKLTKNINK